MNGINGVLNIVCPNCGKDFSVNASEYSSITDQIRAQVEDRIRQDAKEEKEAAVAAAKESILNETRKHFVELKSQLDKTRFEDEKEIERLKGQLAERDHQIEMDRSKQALAIQHAVSSKEEENASLRLELQKTKELAEEQLRTTKAETAVRVKEAEAKMNGALAEKEKTITELQGKIRSADAEKNLAIATVEKRLNSVIDAAKMETTRLKDALANKENEAALAQKAIKDKYDELLRVEKEQTAFYKDYRTKLSTKMLGESLEQHCEISFNRVRMMGFPNAIFEKDNDASSGSKGDYIFRDRTPDGQEYISIMFDMKTDLETTAQRHKNADHLKKLDKDRREKNCEYAVLVSTLESDNELYNQGIVECYEYPKMFIIRPQFFLVLISMLRNAARNAWSYREELEKLQNMHIDIVHFEDNVDKIRQYYQKHYADSLAQHEDAVKQIDNAIAMLEKVKAALSKSDKNSRLAGQSLDDLTIKKLTKDAPQVRKMFDDLKDQKTPEKVPVLEKPDTKAEAS